MALKIKRPMGVTIFGVLIIFLGGIASLALFFQIIDSIRFYGFSSLMIDSVPALFGFLTYGVTPILFYVTGLGLLLLRKWALKNVLLYVPVFSGLFFATEAYKVALNNIYLESQSVYTVLQENPDIVSDAIVRYLLFVLPIFMYFRRLSIREYFTLLSKPGNEVKLLLGDSEN